MKKIKFMLVALLAMLSTNSFAQQEQAGGDPQAGGEQVQNQEPFYMYRLIGNVMYKYDKNEIIPATGTTEATPADGTEAKPYSATVVGLKGTNVTTATFPATETFQNDLGDNVYFKVTAIGENWMDANASLGTVDVKEVLTTLTIVGTNMKAASFANAFKTLKALETLTVAGPFFTNIESLTSRMDAGNKASLKSLDLSGLTITANINDNVFADFEALETIVLPPNLKTIGKSAFVGTVLTSITIPATVTSIGESAFEYIETLVTADLSGAAALTSIGKKAFGHTGITSIVIPAAVTSIGVRAFESNKDLTRVTINAEELTTIPDFCFQGCSALTAITLPETLTAINKNAFFGTGLTTIDIPETVTTLGQLAFQNCESLETVTGMEGITVINKSTFEGCTALTSIALSEEITSVGEKAFLGTQIATLNLPNCESFAANALGAVSANRAENKTLTTVTLGACDIAEFTFANCTALTTVTWDGIPAPEAGDNNQDDNNQEGPIEDEPIEGGNNPEAPAPVLGLVIGNSVSEKAFYGCTGLKNFNYLNGEDDAETEVGAANVHENAFIGCTQFVNFNTSLNYVIAAGGEEYAPLNTQFVYTMPEPPAPEMITLKPVQDKTGSKYFQKFNNPKTIKVEGVDTPNTTYYEIDPDAVDGVYSIYVDEGIAYFQSLRRLQGKYVVAPGDCVILKASTDDDIELTVSDDNRSSSFVDEVFCLGEEISLAAFQTNVLNANYVSNYGQLYVEEGESTNAIKDAGYPSNYMSIWRLTNTTTNGFGFTRYTGSTLKADQFFILANSQTVPAEARLQNIFIDEDGNVENDSDVTAIKQFEAAKTEDGAIYNLQGVRVNKAGKGIFIQNGKKFVK